MGITKSGKEVRWSLTDTAEEPQHINFNVATLCQQHNNCSVCWSSAKRVQRVPSHSNQKSWTVQLNPDKLNKNTININMSRHNNLPTTNCICINNVNNLAVDFSKNLTVTHTSNRILVSADEDTTLALCHKMRNDDMNHKPKGCM